MTISTINKKYLPDSFHIWYEHCLGLYLNTYCFSGISPRPWGKYGVKPPFWGEMFQVPNMGRVVSHFEAYDECIMLEWFILR